MLQICTSYQTAVTISGLHGFSARTHVCLCALRAAPQLIVMKMYPWAPGVRLLITNLSHSYSEEDIIL